MISSELSSLRVETTACTVDQARPSHKLFAYSSSSSPDITGSFGNLVTRKDEAQNGEMGTAYESFSTKPATPTYGVVSYASTVNGDSGRDGIDFRASRSAAVYGLSSTIQTNTIRLLSVIKS